MTDLKSIIKEEYKKCALSCEYFLTRYSYIQHPIRGKVLFDLYNYQVDALKHFEEHDYNIVLKGRQLGFSTLIAGYALWLMLFHSDKNILVIATKQETAKNLVTKVRYMHSALPVWLRANTPEDNKLSMRFSNGSQIKAVAKSKDAGRSEALSLLILDECLGENHTIYIRNKHTGEVRNTSLGELYGDSARNKISRNTEL
jgi:phage terminase large subunit GpA-like protein